MKGDAGGGNGGGGCLCFCCFSLCENSRCWSLGTPGRISHLKGTAPGFLKESSTAIFLTENKYKSKLKKKKKRKEVMVVELSLIMWSEWRSIYIYDEDCQESWVSAGLKAWRWSWWVLWRIEVLTCGSVFSIWQRHSFNYDYIRKRESKNRRKVNEEEDSNMWSVLELDFWAWYSKSEEGFSFDLGFFDLS